MILNLLSSCASIALCACSQSPTPNPEGPRIDSADETLEQRRLEHERELARHRSQLLADLERRAATWPGWSVHGATHSLILTSSEDRDFVEEAGLRADLFRGLLERDFPAPLDEHGFPRPFVGVVRLFDTPEQYRRMGGLSRTAGMFHLEHGEAWIYDDRAKGGRRNTWAVLNAMLFHQWFHHVTGGLEPHTWFSLGTADFYSGYGLRDEQLVLRPFDWRVSTIPRDDPASRSTRPFEKFLRFTHAEFSFGNELGLTSQQNSAQAWSLIYFLRTGHHEKSPWETSWAQILPTTY